MPEPKQEDIEYIHQHIDKEDKTDEILKLVEKGNIDPKECIFWGMNLFHYAASTGNLKLTKALYKKKLIDVNQKTERGYPILVLLAQMYSPKLEHVISFLLDETTDIDFSATYSSGYTASSWAERHNNFPLMRRLLQHEPIDVAANILYNIKLTCLKFGLKNRPEETGFTINSSKLPASCRTINAEGYNLEATIPSLQASFQNFLKDKTTVDNTSIDDMNVLAEVNESLQNQTIYDVEGYNQSSKVGQLYTDFRENKMISIHGQSKGHAASVVMHGNIVYRCNKGTERHPDCSIVKYKANRRRELDQEFIERLLHTISPQEEATLQEIDGIKGKSQYVGNCTVSSPKMAIHAMIYDSITRQYPNLSNVEQKEKARLLYKQWAAWDRKNQIKLLNASCHDIPEVFIELLKSIFYSTGRLSVPHQELAKALAEQLSKEEIEQAFQNLPNQFLSSFEALSINHRHADSKQAFNRYYEFMKDINLPIILIPEKYDILCTIASGDNGKLINLLNENLNLQENQKKVLSTSPSKHNLSCMHLAVLWDNEDALLALIKYHPEFINFRDNKNRTPLHYAISAGNLKLTEILLKNGADQTLCAGTKFQYSVEWILENQIQDPAIRIDFRNMLKQYQKNPVELTTEPTQGNTLIFSEPRETEETTYKKPSQQTVKPNNTM